MNTIIQTEIRAITCSACNAMYGLTVEFWDRAVANGLHWACPHCRKDRHFGGTELEAAKERLARTQTALERQEAATVVAWAAADLQQRRANGFKGQMRKTMKRVGAGVCPCCNRTFSALARHMAAKHPEHVPSCTIAGKEPAAP